LVSMGNYVFRTPALLDELHAVATSSSSTHDFARDVLATACRRLHVHAYAFHEQLCPGEEESSRGYWRDVGTIDSYYRASMDLVSLEPRLNLWSTVWPIRGSHGIDGPAKIVGPEIGGSVRRTLVSPGAVLQGGRIDGSICSTRVRIERDAVVQHSVLFPDVYIGEGARVSRCIVDRGVRIPAGLVVGDDPTHDRALFEVSEEGVVVISRAALGQTDELDIARSLGAPQGERESRPPRAPRPHRPAAAVIR
jgi:glucose-1-phosphate adenylyltransferase